MCTFIHERICFVCYIRVRWGAAVPARVPIVSSFPLLGARPRPAAWWRSRVRALHAVVYRHLAAAAGSAPWGCGAGAEPPGCKTEEKGAESWTGLPG